MEMSNDDFAALEKEFGGPTNLDQVSNDDFAALEKEFGGQAEKKEEFGISDYLAPIARGATLGFGDNISAAMAAPFAATATGNSISSVYKDILADIRGNEKRFTEAHPVASMAGDLAGGVLSGGGLAKLISPGSIKGALKLGAAEGAVSGAGYADEGEVLKGAGLGAGLGAALGPASKVIGDKLMGGGLSKAGRLIQKTMKEQGVGVDDIADFMRSGKRNMPADMDALMYRGQAAANSPGPGQKIARDALLERQGKMSTDVVDSLKQATGGRLDFHENARELKALTKSNAQGLYEQAHKEIVPKTDALMSLVDDPDLSGTWRGANKIHRLNTGRLPNPEDMDKLKVWDYFKQSLDDEIGKAYKAGKGNLGSALKMKREKLLGELDQFDSYKQARSMYSSDKGMEEALTEGRKIFRMDADDIDFAAMSNGEKSMYINGATRAIRDKAYSSPGTGNSAYALTRTPMVRERLRNAFPDDKAYEAFAKNMDTISRQGKTYSDALTGSRTTPLKASMDDLAAGNSIPGAVSDLMQGNVGNSIKGAAGALIKKRGEYVGAKTGADIADALFTNDPAKIKALLKKGEIDPAMLARLLSGLTTGGQGGLLTQ